MNQSQRKAWIIEQLESSQFENIHEAWHVIGGEFQSLEAMPFGVRTKPNHVFTDFMDNRISGEESVHALLAIVMEIPDAA